MVNSRLLGNKKRIIFLSHFINENTPIYGGKRRVKISSLRGIKKKYDSNLVSLKLPNHASTHIDLPSHFLKNGKTLSDYDPGFWIFKNIQLMNLKLRSHRITEACFKNLKKETELLLIKTGFEKHRSKKIYCKNTPYLDYSCAAYLKKKMPLLRAIGIDSISISSPRHREEGRKTHYEFLKREILIIEDMKLIGLKKAPAFVIASPLLIEGADGAPATVFGVISNDRRISHVKKEIVEW